MAQGLQRTEADDEPGLMLDINTTPLIDVLLVLLVMLIITIPVQLHAVKMALPVASALPAGGERITVEIDSESNVLWQGQRVTAAQLDARFARLAEQTATQQQQPDIEIRTHRAAAYGVFVQVLASSRRHGLSRVAVAGTEVFAP